MKLSIIIPVYNSADTLQRCVGSILSQSFRDYEIIIINDGSTDNSGKIAEEMAAEDSRICVFHKNNGGQSEARNYGIDRAKEEYITFVDSDDMLAPETFAPLFNTIREHPEYDILEYSFMERIGHPDERYFDLGEHVYTDAKEWLANRGFQHCWSWNKIFRRSLFDDVRFPHRDFAEDLWLMGELLKKNLTIATTSAGTYLYYWNSNGTTAKKESCKDLLQGQLDIIEKLGIDTRKPEWHGLYMDILNIQLYFYFETGKIIIPSQKIVPRTYNGMQGLIKSLALDILGLHMSCLLFKIFLKCKYSNRNV